MDERGVEVQFDNSKRGTHWVTDVADLVPDIVPRPDEVKFFGLT